ncbi:MAG: RNA polymerase sigma-70 factor [bacterium]
MPKAQQISIGRKSARPQNKSQWVAKIQSGDEAAFEKLFFEYCQPLIHFARRFVEDTTVAENLVQDVFLKVWENRSQLNPTLNIKSYLYTAVKNQALKQIKHHEVRRRGAEKLRLDVDSVVSPEETWCAKELEEAIQQGISELPEKCRIIFRMNRFDQLKYAEIAHIQNISIKTVEVQMGRALKFLRKRLADFVK